MSEQTNAAAERSAHVTRGGGVVPAEWPVVQLPDGTWQLKAVAERDAEIEKLRAALRQIADQSCDTFQINPEGGQSIAVEGHYRFAFEEDVKALLSIARVALGEKE